MKKQLIHSVLAMIFSVTTANTGGAQTFAVMSYNIKYDNVRDTINNGHDRKGTVARLIDHYNPAFLGLQEALAHQVNFLNEALTNYSFVGVGRDDGKTKGEYSALFYDKTRFKVIESSTFWLSESPNRVSVGWDAAMERVCTYGLFEHLTTNRRIWVFNTHFDHLGQDARAASAALIIKKIQALNNGDLPVILMGDFNLPYKKLKKYFPGFEIATKELKTCSITPIMKWFFWKDCR